MTEDGKLPTVPEPDSMITDEIVTELVSKVLKKLIYIYLEVILNYFSVEHVKTRQRTCSGSQKYE